MSDKNDFFFYIFECPAPEVTLQKSPSPPTNIVSDICRTWIHCSECCLFQSIYRREDGDTATVMIHFQLLSHSTDSSAETPTVVKHAWLPAVDRLLEQIDQLQVEQSSTPLCSLRLFLSFLLSFWVSIPHACSSCFVLFAISCLKVFPLFCDFSASGFLRVIYSCLVPPLF